MSGTMPNDHPSDATGPAPDPADVSPEAPPRWAHYETDLSSVLAFAPHDTPLEVLQIADPRARAYCARLGLDEGDRITRNNGRRDDVLLTTADGRRMRLALPIAMLVEVEPGVPS